MQLVLAIFTIILITSPSWGCWLLELNGYVFHCPNCGYVK